ncbi:hypothetical protein ACI2JN_23110 [Ochrobactrum teleogrylli]|uniref:hypothetical protein n=1 Tax=Ochrobactrum teleogrylli TaxID=2479765 RepID=UPI00384C4F6D
MRVIKIYFILVTLFTATNDATPNTIPVSLNSSVELLNKLYYGQVEICEAAANFLKESAIKRSGVMVHGQEAQETHVWIPSQNDPRKAVSFSYLRYDIPTSKLYNPAGFIYDQFNSSVLDYYCLYPFDADTVNTDFHPSSSHGCGLSGTDYKENDFASCPKVSVATSDEFIQKYLKNREPQPQLRESCSFIADKKEGFEASINVQKETKSPYWNELIMSNWTEAEARTLPITAFFYIFGSDAGRRTALRFQADYCSMYKKFIPVVSLDFKKEADAFKGSLDDQQPCP